MSKKSFLLAVSIFAMIPMNLQAAAPLAAKPIMLERNERLLTILATNDMHGGVEPELTKDGAKRGGLAVLSGVTQAIRQGLSDRFGNRAGVALVDGGDQFQGTLISNYDEGQLLFSAMDLAGYDVAIPGNHDYDFGPIGWLEDKVTSETESQDPRSAFKRIISQVSFPMISANTYLKNSIVDRNGRPVEVDNVRCAAPSGSEKIDWSRAVRPDFIKPYVIKEMGGVRVAFIGIDSDGTPKTTGIENVSDLCFRSEDDTYLDARAELEGKADVFVMIIHEGNIGDQTPVTKLVAKLTNSGDKNVLHAVISSHTHSVTNHVYNNVPIIQSGAGAEKFGRIDLIWNTASREVVAKKTRSFAGIELRYDSCPASVADFCAVKDGTLYYEGVAAQPDSKIEEKIAKARQVIAPIANRRLGVAEGEIKRDRYVENPLSNALTDGMRDLAKVDVTFLNMGGLRDNLSAGEVTYEELFKVVPFNNRTVVLGPVSAPSLIQLLQNAITCGNRGALLQSGLRVVFERSCRTQGNNGISAQVSRLLKVETVSGEVLLDVKAGVQPDPNRNFRIATLDYLASGGAGYNDFASIPLVKDLGILREVLTEEYLSNPARFSPTIDGRWKELRPEN